VLLLGEVDVAECLAADEDRRAEEAAHRRVSDRKAVGVRMLADVAKAKRAGLADEDSQEPVPTRQVADRAVRLRIDAEREEALEALASLVQDPERRILRAGELLGDLQHPVEQALDVEFRDESSSDFQQAEQPLLPKGGVSSGTCQCNRVCRVSRRQYRHAGARRDRSTCGDCGDAVGNTARNGGATEAAPPRVPPVCA